MDNLHALYKTFIKDAKKCKLSVFFIVFLVVMSLWPSSSVIADQIPYIVNKVSREYDISSDFIYRVIEAESSFNAQAVSRCDARGLMQITRPTWNWICREFLDVNWDFDVYAFDPEKNIIVGTRFLKWIEKYLESNREKLNDSKGDLILACYNAGPGAVRTHGFRVPPFPETISYVNKINK
ncbi:MAG: lytic transglycosylase domain-containing protein [PVC group bacterium]|nr:lytic transglycosylase domain-containing protein [PVC group bacterium]